MEGEKRTFESRPGVGKTTTLLSSLFLGMGFESKTMGNVVIVCDVTHFWTT